MNLFCIKCRTTGDIHVGGFATREEAKPERDHLNCLYYKNKEVKGNAVEYPFKGKQVKVPLQNREYWVARTHNHRLGKS